MIYRKEIDGLRAIAVLSVIAGHAEFSIFRGGFVGVDIFFVISGYLITTIIMNELDSGLFSIIGFYERRARRILPALFLVMLATTPFAYMWMMPDEFKNFGQSIAATALFSNNILLAITSGYWEMASYFKPLLHTWSLGVEEQYYVVFPIFMIFSHKGRKSASFIIMFTALLVSFAVAAWGANYSQNVSFYILPTRGWEMLAGALTAHWMNYGCKFFSIKRINNIENIASAIGLLLITFSIFTFSENVISPGPWIAVPVLGAVLLIAFANPGTMANRLLSNRIMVGVGLISYSLYLWHQPLFAMARVHEINPITSSQYIVLIAIAFILAYLTWRFVEIPFRNRNTISSKGIFTASLCCSLCAVGFGVYLDRTYGMYWRAFDVNDKISDFDKRIYNSRIFSYKTGRFLSTGQPKILVIGNSFGRDFVNMIDEFYRIGNFDLVYTDLHYKCMDSYIGSREDKIFLDADLIVFASGPYPCAKRDVDWATARHKEIFYLGTKSFGYNLNWIIQLPKKDRKNQYNKISAETMRQQNLERSQVPGGHFISLLDPLLKDGKVPITDDNGKMISVDRTHVTKFGAAYFAKYSINTSQLGKVLSEYKNRGRR